MALCSAEVTRTTVVCLWSSRMPASRCRSVITAMSSIRKLIMLSDKIQVLMRDPRIRDAYLGGETTMAS